MPSANTAGPSPARRSTARRRLCGRTSRPSSSSRWPSASTIPSLTRSHRCRSVAIWLEWRGLRGVIV
eukprot:4426879-Prymnesium_polylepis.1